MLDDRLSVKRSIQLRQRAVLGVDPLSGSQLGHELDRAGVERPDRRGVRFGHDQPVAEALDRHREPLALGLEALLCERERLAHRVE